MNTVKTKLNKTQIGFNAIKDLDLNSRKELYDALINKGLVITPIVFNRIAKLYEATFKKWLGESQADRKKAIQQEKQALRAKAFKLDIKQAKEVLNNPEDDSELGWVIWNLFKYNEKFSRQLKKQDFKKLFDYTYNK